MAARIRIRAKDYRRVFGLFIGIEKFEQSTVDIPALYHANQDAEAMCNLIKSQQTRLRNDAMLWLLVDEPYRPQIQAQEGIEVGTATRTNILVSMSKALKQAQKNDLVLVYISTHGMIAYDDYFFIPSDGDSEYILATGIAASTLVAAAGKASARGVKVLFCIDTCHAGAVSFDLSKYQGAFSCLLSSSPIEQSYELFNQEHSIFTHYLLQGLRGGAATQERLGERRKRKETITLIDLFDYVYRNVQRESQKRQNPVLIGTMKYDTVLAVASINETERKKE